MRRFRMTAKGLTEDEAISLMSGAVDFAVTHIVDANWGIHTILKKSIFADEAGQALRRPACGARINESRF
jgi:acetamidase/formamidase